MKKALHDKIQEAIQKGWTDLSKSFGTMEDEVVRRFRKARRHASPQQAADDVQTTLADLGKRLYKSSHEVEQTVEENIRTMASKVKTPLSEELASLRERAEKLSQRIESQVRRRSAKKDEESSKE